MKTLDKMRKLFHRHNSLSSTQGTEDSASLSLSQGSSKIPQQQSSSRKNFGPSSIEGRGRSRTPLCAAPRGGSPYPQSPPPPPPKYSTQGHEVQHGDTQSRDQHQGGGQTTSTDRHHNPNQVQLEGHLQSHEQVSLVSRGSGPEGPVGHHPVLQHEVFGLWCDLCNRRLVELKRQALRLWMPFASSRGTTTIKVSVF